MVVGTVDEDFAVESNRGDIMLLGNTSWIIHRVETNSGRMLVQDAHGAPPSVPFWRGEAPARTQELSEYVGNLREKISEMLPGTSPVGFSATQPEVAAAVAWLKEECGLDDSGAEQAIEYILQGRAVLGAVPTQTTVIDSVDRRRHRRLVFVRKQFDARKRRPGENLRERIVATLRARPGRSTGEVAAQRRRNRVPRRKVEPDAVVVGLLDVPRKYNRPHFRVKEITERTQDRVLVGHPVERLRDGRGSERAELCRQSSQIVRAAENEREVLDAGGCSSVAVLINHRFLGVHDDNLRNERGERNGDVRRAGAEIEEASGTQPLETGGEQPKESVCRAVAVVGVEIRRTPKRPLAGTQARPRFIPAHAPGA